MKYAGILTESDQYVDLVQASRLQIFRASSLTDTERALAVAGIAATATVTAAVVAAAAAYFSSRLDRRRILYSEAVRAAVAWKELLYRVRRRADSDEAAHAIIALFHDTQDQLTYYQGWVGSDSKYMARSYKRLVRRVKTTTEPLIQEAWQASPRLIPGSAISSDVHPDIETWTEEFLKDVRSHLSWQPWRKLAVVLRNTEKVDAKTEVTQKAA